MQGEGLEYLNVVATLSVATTLLLPHCGHSASGVICPYVGLTFRKNTYRKEKSH